MIAISYVARRCCFRIERFWVARSRCRVTKRIKGNPFTAALAVLVAVGAVSSNAAAASTPTYGSFTLTVPKCIKTDTAILTAKFAPSSTTNLFEMVFYKTYPPISGSSAIFGKAWVPEVPTPLPYKGMARTISHEVPVGTTITVVAFVERRNRDGSVIGTNVKMTVKLTPNKSCPKPQ